MSKLYVSCIVVALLALAVMPAIAGELADGYTGTVVSGDTAQVVVTATVPKYVNVDVLDLGIVFPVLVATYVGYVEATDTANYTISTNTPLQIAYANGTDLTETGGTYALDLEFSLRAWGDMDWAGGINYFTATGGWSPWGPCGTVGGAQTGSTNLGEDTGTVGIAECQQFRAENKAQLYQNGINDPAGDYTQARKLLLTISVL